LRLPGRAFLSIRLASQGREATLNFLSVQDYCPAARFGMAGAYATFLPLLTGSPTPAAGWATLPLDWPSTPGFVWPRSLRRF